MGKREGERESQGLEHVRRHHLQLKPRLHNVSSSVHSNFAPLHRSRLVSGVESSLPRRKCLHLNFAMRSSQLVIGQHLERSPVFVPRLYELHGTWEADEHQEYKHALQRINDVEHCRRRLVVERNYFKNPINRHDDCEEGCAFHAAIERLREEKERKKRKWKCCQSMFVVNQIREKRKRKVSPRKGFDSGNSGISANTFVPSGTAAVAMMKPLFFFHYDMQKLLLGENASAYKSQE